MWFIYYDYGYESDRTTGRTTGLDEFDDLDTARQAFAELKQLTKDYTDGADVVLIEGDKIDD
jgi:hypothetical protein